MMASITAYPTIEPVSGEPQWLERSLHVTPGRDPLGFQTITTDRIMPRLVPGILALSRRARYFSYYTFLLDEYQNRRMAASNREPSNFIRFREYEYAVAIQLCSRGCGERPTGAIGKERAGPVARRLGVVLDRDYSVESPLGGYGLYYRTPLSDVGLVAPQGTPLGDGFTPVDVLHDDRARQLAQAFRDVVAGTDYYRNHMFGFEPIPVAALREFSDKACLCQVHESPLERQLIRQAFLDPADGLAADDVQRRREAFGLFLSVLDREPRAGSDDGAFRSGIWEMFLANELVSTRWADAIARWAALIAKEYLQEAMSSIWSHFCRLGHERQHPNGFDRDGLRRLIRVDLCDSTPLDLFGEVISTVAEIPTLDFAATVEHVAAAYSLEEVRRWAVELDTAAAGLALLLLLYRRLPNPADLPVGWREIGLQASDFQPGLLGFGALLQAHLSERPTVADSVTWIVQRYVLAAHEAIAYSRLPNYVFRFRRESGRLRFFDNGLWRFDITDSRRDALARLSEDLGYWRKDQSDLATLADDGRRLVEEAH